MRHWSPCQDRASGLCVHLGMLDCRSGCMAGCPHQCSVPCAVALLEDTRGWEEGWA